MNTTRKITLTLLSFCLFAVSSGCTPTVITVRQFPTTPDAVSALRGGELAAVYGDFPAMAYAARESQGTLAVVRRQFNTGTFGIALDQDATELRGAISSALATLINDSTYTNILRTWALEGGRVEAPAEASGTVPEASTIPQLADGTLQVGMDISFAPMGFTDEAGQQAGVDIELGRALADRLGVEVEFVNMDFDELFSAVSSGRVDVAMSAITITEERSQQVRFIEYLESGSAILVQTGNPLSIEYPANLCGRTVGTQEGTIQITQLQELPCY